MLIGNGNRMSVSLTLLLSWTTIFLEEIVLVVARDECTSHADCYTDELKHLVCCKDSRDSERKCTQHNCVGRYCATDGDCSKSECCINSVCTDSHRCQRCDSKNHCVLHEFCCKRGNNSNVCRRSCEEEDCAKDTDCGGPREFCDSYGICKKREFFDTESLSSGAIAGIIIGSIVGLVLLVTCFCFIRRNMHYRGQTPPPILTDLKNVCSCICNNDSNQDHCETQHETLSQNLGTSQNPGPSPRPNSCFFNLGHEVPRSPVLRGHQAQMIPPLNQRPGSIGHSNRIL